MLFTYPTGMSKADSDEFFLRIGTYTVLALLAFATLMAYCLWDSTTTLVVCIPCV